MAESVCEDTRDPLCQGKREGKRGTAQKDQHKALPLCSNNHLHGSGKEITGLAAAEHIDTSESQARHESTLSHGCEKAHVIGGHVRSCMLHKASEVFLLLLVPVKPWLEPFLSHFRCYISRKM